jgi:hypothetical protein
MLRVGFTEHAYILCGLRMWSKKERKKEIVQYYSVEKTSDYLVKQCVKGCVHIRDAIPTK